jgi:hypothetical protein
VVGGTTVGGQVQPQPWVYKKPDAKESDPLSLGVNMAKKLGVNSLLTTALESIGSMSHENQKYLLDLVGSGLNKGYKAVTSLVGDTATETEAEKTAKAKALSEAAAATSNTTPVKLADAIPKTEPTKPPVIARDTFSEKKEPTDGLAGVTQNVVAPTTLSKNMTNANAGEEGYLGGYYIPNAGEPGYVGLEESKSFADKIVPLTNSSETTSGTSDSYKNKDELYITNTSVAQQQNVENKQVESLTPAEIEELKQSSVLPTRYPTPISQPTSAAPTSAVQPVDNSEVSNLDYMKSVVYGAIATSAYAFQKFLFDNPLLRDTVQQAVVQGAKTVGDVLPYLRQFINGLPREEIRQRFRRTMV